MKENHYKNNLLSQIENSFKYKLIVCSTLCAIILLGFLFVNKIVDTKNFRKYTVAESVKLINSIENVNIENNELILSGYAFVLEKDSIDSSVSLFLRNVDKDHEIWLSIENTERPDVNTFYNSEYNYLNSGFNASTDVKKLKEDEVYEIFINIDYMDSKNEMSKRKVRTTVSSHRYILNNELYLSDPMLKLETNIESNLLKEVFLFGQLCFYQKDAGMFVYYYDNELYWIATNEFEFNLEGKTNIPVQVFTSDIDKLPKHRKKHKFDNIGFYFEEYEYKDEKTSPYRVAICDLTTEYPITHIKTGVYDNENKLWVWSRLFQLHKMLK